MNFRLFEKRTAKMILLLILASSIASCSSAVYPPVAYAQKPATEGNSGDNELINRFWGATALLYKQDDSGTMAMVCTATAFERGGGNTYRFITASHCVAKDDDDKERVELYPKEWYITFDDPQKKNFLHAKVVAAGYQHRGDDFAVLEVESKEYIPVMPFAPKRVTLGEQVINIASPGGYGKQLFQGIVSMPELNRPVKVRDINWKKAVMLQMNLGGGSSGSAVVSVKQGGMAAFVVGQMYGSGAQNVVAIPAHKFHKFWKAAKAGKYKWFKPPKDN